MFPYKMMEDNWNDLFSKKNQPTNDELNREDDIAPTWLFITIVGVLLGGLVIRCIIG
jgi:hypothetical protein